jgi:hypothetical protein
MAAQAAAGVAGQSTLPAPWHLSQAFLASQLMVDGLSELNAAYMYRPATGEVTINAPASSTAPAMASVRTSVSILKAFIFAITAISCRR